MDAVRLDTVFLDAGGVLVHPNWQRVAAALRSRLIRNFGQPTDRGQDPATGTESVTWDRPDEINLDQTPGQPVIMLHCSRGT